MISVDEARTTVLERVLSLGTEKIPLADAGTRVLRAAAISDRDQPPFNRAAMDGFAVLSEDAAAPQARLRVIGEVRAGVWPESVVRKGEAMRIMTGAPVPKGADAVIQVERTKLVGSAEGGASHFVLLETAVAAGQNIVPLGSEARAGTVLLREGARLGPAQIAVLAACGMAEPLVSRQPRVAVIVTGDEVVDPGHKPAAAQIRNANGPALMAAIHEAGGLPADFGVVPDDPGQTRAALERGFGEGHDAIVLSGGVSAGDFDFVESSLGETGVKLHITSVRVKPGAPFVFGTRGPTLIFGLPGNPVSAQVTFELFVRPALLLMQGASAFLRPTFEATLEAPLHNRSGRRNYLPVTVSSGPTGLRATPVRTQGSGDTLAHALAHALAILEPDQTSVAAAGRVAIYPLPSFFEV